MPTNESQAPKWLTIGCFDVVTDSTGRVIAKIQVGPGKHQPNQLPCPMKLWVFERFIGEYVTQHAAKAAAEAWLKLGEPTP